MDKIILASTSPRRQELLGLLVERFEVCPPAPTNRCPGVRRRRTQCGCWRCARPERWPDAVPGHWSSGRTRWWIWMERSWASPPGEREAVQMLLALSGRRHRVHTGIALVDGRW